MNFLEQMQSCEELEPEILQKDPLIHEFPDILDKLRLKLTAECESVLETMRQSQTKQEVIAVKLDKSYETLERLYFDCCRYSTETEDEPSSIDFVSKATATRPSYTFMLNELKSVVDSFHAEINRQTVMREQLTSSGEEAGRVLESIQKLLPLKREGVAKSKVLLLYVQFFLKEETE